MSERIHTPLRKEVIAVSLRLAAPDRDAERILTLVVPEAHLGKVIRDSGPPVGWTTFILDYKLQQVRWNEGTSHCLATADAVGKCFGEW